MSPPTEQLVRDYLNRLSLAARPTLGFSDRQVLLDQVRARIEADSGGMRKASPAEVRRVLATLGDPIAVVEAVHARLAAGQGILLRGATDHGAVRQAVAGPVAAGPGAMESAASVSVVTEIPRPAESPEDLPGRARPAPGGGSSAPGGGSSAPGGGSSAPGRSGARGRPSRSRRSANVPFAAAMTALPAPTGGTGGPEDDQPGPPDDPAESGLPRWWPFTPPTAGGGSDRPPGQVGRAAARLLSLPRRHKVETLAIILLGLGGATYPPVWIAGVLVALPCRQWDRRDKWISLAAPVFLLVVGTVAVVVLGGAHVSLGAYAVEAWRGADLLSRMLALASGGYLLVRLLRGRREPRLPPWNVPHRLS
ncbi:MAG: hypothetical protein ACYCO9_12040 [Streptosporangiaceae bacterium]